MDLDGLDERSQVPSRTSRFAPKSSKFKPKPKSEVVPKPEPQQPTTKLEPQPPVSKPEVVEPDAQIGEKKEDGEEVEVKPKVESSLPNGVAKMDVETKSEVEEDTMVDDDPMEEDASEDMVVREIDVLFTPSVDSNSKLYVLQYPLRPRWRPYEFEGRCDEVRVKPSTGEVEIDLNVDIESNNYDSKADDTFQMKKQTLTSSWQPPLATSYALHLNPVHAVVQLRPSFEHLNSGGPKRKNNIRADSDVKSEEHVDVNSAGASRKQKKQTGPSTELKTRDEECWIPLKYYGLESDLSTRHLQSMVSQTVSPMQFSMSPHDYMDSLCPGTSTSSNKPKGPSKKYLLSLSLEERIKKLLTEGPPVQRFSALKHYAPDYEAEEFLEALQQYAQLVQGLWVPKSLFLIPQDGSGRCARDFVLFLFSKNPVVSSSQINVPKSLRDRVKHFLNLFGVERPAFKDWKFKEKTDHSFLSNHVKIVQKQEEGWNAMEKALPFLRSMKSGPHTTATTGKPDVVPKPEKQVSCDKTTTKSSNAPLNRKGAMSDETREALPKALQKLFQNHKVCSFQLICQGLRDLAVSQSTLPKADARMAVAAAYGVDAPPEELKKIISQVATEIHGLYVLTSSPEHPEYDPLRKVVIQLLRGRGPKAVLKKADVLEASKRELGRAINSNEYSKVMNEICVSHGSSWTLKSGDGNSR
ncbi:DNA-directed RNA polymerase III subunit RPC5 isoform X1 [Cucumis melo var. makuwa]|uniref:DNA-directed RNA polymerase III subunit RPC5 isoform X1 n=1 Tax=Cucumis melo var. makuwa TaxID=1194695 RepID=A0A5A7TMP0_CUCMM|nr:DNA-directed RNA polymerase III subunit RPC5 isoform X1 [Cucumis melo var. makuwa]